MLFYSEMSSVSVLTSEQELQRTAIDAEDVGRGGLVSGGVI